MEVSNDNDNETEKSEIDSSTLESTNENGLLSDTVTIDTDSSKQINERTEMEDDREKTVESSCAADETSNLSRTTRETISGTKVKRKLRSTRKKLNAMINNTSLHFSDTDSEGELTTINYQVRTFNYATNEQRGPVISITTDDAEEAVGSNYLSPDDKGPSQPNSFVENLTDVDEIYPSESENEQKENQYSLKIDESPCQGDTDLEDFEGEDEVHSMIYVKPRSDIFCDYSGETITTKEGDGPFSVEVRSKLYLEKVPRNELCSNTPDIVVMSNTDEEDMCVSEEEDVQEACCSQRELLEDLDVLAASQIVMKNINKMENMLNVKDTSDDMVSDCHTDVEDVE